MKSSRQKKNDGAKSQMSKKSKTPATTRCARFAAIVQESRPRKEVRKYRGTRDSRARQSLPNYNDETVAYRLEAERLFNIRTNLGVSSNEDRRMMIERLIDMKEKDVPHGDGLEGNKGDQ
ncbi:hypothetical protein L195_g016874 [Trifolium pratense]|uniref:Uncharacterized protein n=1 Tax=Trifolium pratense TaxID=57577 RepID=A0A2K3MSG8_TRIPR|nr:hypothetical protein L195_g016874 [Trifolium pratense]